MVGLLLDVGSSMAYHDGDGMSHLDKAKDIISMFLQRKVRAKLENQPIDLYL